jgi:hypothetical protein
MHILTTFWKWLEKAPSFVWILIFLGGIIGLMGGSILLFFLLANVEGVASLIFLISGWFMAKALAGHKTPGHQIWVAGAITFYALMGMAVDQPGNPIFNQPLQWFCPADSRLNRGVNVSHPLPERTDITQDYRCLDKDGKTVKYISMGPVIGLRFIEYVVLAYIMIAIASARSTKDPHHS